jgi:hypothetical protein
VEEKKEKEVVNEKEKEEKKIRIITTNTVFVFFDMQTTCITLLTAYPYLFTSK